MGTDHGGCEAEIARLTGEVEKLRAELAEARAAAVSAALEGVQTRAMRVVVEAARNVVPRHLGRYRYVGADLAKLALFDALDNLDAPSDQRRLEPR